MTDNSGNSGKRTVSALKKGDKARYSKEPLLKTDNEKKERVSFLSWVKPEN